MAQSKFKHPVRCTIDKDKPSEQTFKFTVVVELDGMTDEQKEFAVVQKTCDNFYNNTHPSKATKTQENRYDSDLEYYKALDGTEIVINGKDYINLPGEGKAPKVKTYAEMEPKELRVLYDAAVANVEMDKARLIKTWIEKKHAETMAAVAGLGVVVPEDASVKHLKPGKNK